jgi:hypothetical protein
MLYFSEPVNYAISFCELGIFSTKEVIAVRPIENFFITFGSTPF